MHRAYNTFFFSCGHNNKCKITIITYFNKYIDKGNTSEYNKCKELLINDEQVLLIYL
jgi:hypothetical protein